MCGGRTRSLAYPLRAPQVLLRLCGPAERDRLLRALLPKLAQLACGKHGSNVAEAMLLLATPEQLEDVGRRVFAGDDHGLLDALLGSAYGNYVLQTLLKRLPVAAHADALRRVQAHTTQDNFGRSVLCGAGASSPP